MTEINRRNSLLESWPVGCASHDFTDSNVHMAANFALVMGKRMSNAQE